MDVTPPRFSSAAMAPFPNPSPLPAAGSGHRRAHSETFIRLPDDFLFDPDPDPDPDFNFSDLVLPSFSDESASIGAATAGVADLPAVEKVKPGRPAGGAHLRSLSVDAAFFEGLGFQDTWASDRGGGGSAESGPRHRRKGSLDGSTSPFEGDHAVPSSDYAKKSKPADKLADLALIDPKRAKRILANRQSAARSKERKICYTSELERKVQALQTEATALSAQLTLLQRDGSGLTLENRELKLRLQAMEDQAKLRDALSETLREEVQRLKMAAGQLPNAANKIPSNRGLQQSISPCFSQSQQPTPYLGGHHDQHRHPNQPQNNSNGRDPMDFM